MLGCYTDSCNTVYTIQQRNILNFRVLQNVKDWRIDMWTGNWSTNRNVDDQNVGRPKRRQTKTSTNRNVDKPKRRQTKTPTNRNVDNPKRRQTETSTDWNVDTPVSTLNAIVGLEVHKAICSISSFSPFFMIVKNCWPVEDHIDLWQMSPQFSWMWVN